MGWLAGGSPLCRASAYSGRGGGGVAELFEGARGEIEEVEKRGDGGAEQPGLRRRKVTARRAGQQVGGTSSTQAEVGVIA